MDRIIIPLNWVLGTILLIIAVIYPVLDDHFLTGMKKEVVENRIMQLIRMEEMHYQLNEKFILFPPGQMPKAYREELGIITLKDEEFVYDAFQEADGTFVLRAQAESREIKGGKLPPLTYEYRLNGASGESQHGWLRLSGKKTGLGLF